MSTEAEPSVSTAAPASPDDQAWPYFVPLVGFIVLTALEGQLPKTPTGDPVAGWFVAAYALKMVVVSVLLWVCRPTWKDLKPLPSAGGLALAVGLGVAVIVVWVGLDPFYPKFEALMGKRTAFDPGSLPSSLRVPFLALRFFGLVVLVPIIEELFYRSFLIRWIIDPEFARIPIGKVTAAGLGVTAAMFGASHPEWLPAVLTALAWGWLLARTKSVSACVVSHATANLVLGVYVLITGDWKYW